MIWKHDGYLDKSIDYIISSDIIEYDMASSGLSIIKEHKMLSDDVIEDLEALPKYQRNVKIGLIMRSDKEFQKTHRSYLREHRKIFMEANGLTDDDILSIKSDAIFVKKRCLNTTFGHIVFKEKNEYTSYYYLNKKEIYVGKENIDIKGISDDVLDKYHRDYLCKELWTMMKTIETADQQSCIRRLRHMIDKYKNLEYPIEYYRELSQDSRYRLKEFDYHKRVQVMANEIGDKSMIDISYNYIKYIVPLISLLI